MGAGNCAVGLRHANVFGAFFRLEAASEEQSHRDDISRDSGKKATVQVSAGFSLDSKRAKQPASEHVGEAFSLWCRNVLCRAPFLLPIALVSERGEVDGLIEEGIKEPQQFETAKDFPEVFPACRATRENPRGFLRSS